MTAPIPNSVTQPPKMHPGNSNLPSHNDSDNSDSDEAVQDVRHRIGGGCPACGMGVPVPNFKG